MPTPLNNIRGIFSSVAKVSEVFKGDNKKWSAKRSVSGVLVGAVMLDVTALGITWENAIAVAPLIASAFEKAEK